MQSSLSLLLKLWNIPANCIALLDDSSSTKKCSVWWMYSSHMDSVLSALSTCRFWTLDPTSKAMRWSKENTALTFSSLPSTYVLTVSFWINHSFSLSQQPFPWLWQQGKPSWSPPFTVRCLGLYLCLNTWYALQQAVQPFCPFSFAMETEAASSQDNLLPN